MRKLLLLAFTVVSFANVNAQENETVGGFEKKDLYISGTVDFNSSSVSNTDIDSYTFTISPSVGYFISENIALELGVAFGIGEIYGVLGKSEINIFGANLGAKYFFTPSNKFSFFMGARVSYLNQASKLNGIEGNDINTFGLGIAPGINYFVSEAVALRASVGSLSYTNRKEDADGANASNNFDLNLDLSNIVIGITYKF